MSGDVMTYSRSVLQSVDDFSEALAMMAPEIHAPFTLLALDQKLEVMKAYRAGNAEKLLELLKSKTEQG